MEEGVKSEKLVRRREREMILKKMTRERMRGIIIHVWIIMVLFIYLFVGSW